MPYPAADMAEPLPLFRAYHDEAMERNALEVLRSGAIAAGSFNTRFDAEFGALIGHKWLVTMNDMSNAIFMALRLAGVGPGDEVLTTPFACMSTNSPIAMAGARPAWVDVDPVTATIDLDSFRKAITKRTKALILYHVSGYPGPADEVSAICQENGIVLIEDCDNALLAKLYGRTVGSFGRFSVYSFYPNRQINASEGGALGCRLRDDMERGIRLRRYGIDLSKFRRSDGEINPECDIPEIGWAATLNNLCSALGLAQIESVAGRVDGARMNAETYDGLLDGLDAIVPISRLPGAEPSYWTYMVRAKNRDALMAYLKGLGIGCSCVHFLNTAYSGFHTVAPDLPGSYELMESILSLPCGWWMGKPEVRRVAEAIEGFGSNGS